MAKAAIKPARGQIREALQSSGIRLVAARGLEHINVADILDDAGVSRRTFYSYFANKFELVASVINPALLDGAAALERLNEKTDDELIPGIVDCYLDLWDTHADALIAITGLDQSMSPYIETSHRQYGAAMKRLLKRAAQSGLLRNDDAMLSFKVISRTAVPLLKLYSDSRNEKQHYREAMLALLEKPE